MGEPPIFFSQSFEV